MTRKIEKDVPLPKSNAHSGVLQDLVRLAGAEIGSSIFFDNQRASNLNSIINAASKRRVNTLNLKGLFTMKKEAKGVRVWRIK